MALFIGRCSGVRGKRVAWRPVTVLGDHEAAKVTKEEISGECEAEVVESRSSSARAGAGKSSKRNEGAGLLMGDTMLRAWVLPRFQHRSHITRVPAWWWVIALLSISAVVQVAQATTASSISQHRVTDLGRALSGQGTAEAAHRAGVDLYRQGVSVHAGHWGAPMADAEVDTGGVPWWHSAAGASSDWSKGEGSTSAEMRSSL